MLLLDWLKSFRARFGFVRDSANGRIRRRSRRGIQLYCESLEERLMLDGTLPVASLSALSADYSHSHGYASNHDLLMMEGGTATAVVTLNHTRARLPFLTKFALTMFYLRISRRLF
jgi:hypothetical protein